jgi:hypothetical protein
MRAFSPALLTVLLLACGPAAGDDGGDGSEGSSGDSGSGDGTGSTDAGDSTTGAPACDPSTPEIPDAVTITIRNDDTEPRYLAETTGCVMGAVFGLSRAGSDEPLSWIVEHCSTCSAVIDGACACPADCPADAAIRIDPGGVYVSQWTGGIATPVELSPECAHPDCGSQCTAIVEAEPGQYVARVVAGRTIDCFGGACDCVDEQVPAGWCRVNGTTSGEDAITVEREFQYPSGISIELVIGGE